MAVVHPVQNVLAVQTAGSRPLASAQPAPAASESARTIPYSIAIGTPDSGFRAADTTLARWALEAWGSRAEPALDFALVPEVEATIRIHFVPAGAGQYGEMRARMVDGRVVADVYIRPDTDALGPDIASVMGCWDRTVTESERKRDRMGTPATKDPGVCQELSVLVVGEPEVMDLLTRCQFRVIAVETPEAALFEIDQQHLARLQAPLLDDFVFRDL